ncbi:GntR family transcriptional regulator [Pusillimonas sp. ANT_WB101]|uniref:GntR family transcriptional regulator n=1 Tax=Pusillimonas sp. ANT_WB101 TaxID=2597356 RepID=UPI0011EC49F1|nr:GntR family transcriptional regulator [Pusillimonas sp. ANT_WB101]KAA0892806.1 GntR family transcriptional regulator [Pusillimonas sp. ANT_WB101]
MKISERIRQSIEEDIRMGHLLPGDIIDENAVAQKFGASRTPVREALLQLEAQSMLISQPRQGMVVAKMDVRQLLAIWELLCEIEGVCARLACERMTEQEIEKLEEVHVQAQLVVDNDDVEGWRAVNHAFHDVLYQGSRNPYLRQEILRLRARTGGYLQHAFSALGRLHSSQEQHGELLEAIKARDPKRAHEKMMEHISLDQGARGLTDFIINLPSSLINT